LGGIRFLTILYVGIGLLMLSLGWMPPLLTGTVLLFLGMGFLGMGNGAVFLLVPQRFSRELGVVTGIIGAAGGLGGFFLPSLLGALRQWTGSFSCGFLAFGWTSLLCAAGLVYVSRVWEQAFVGRGGLSTGLQRGPLADPEATA
jgi:NNP family nitrate/nitrite transporter-like MFS transporter